VLSVAPKQREGVITRRSGFREMTVFADVSDGVLADNEIIEFSRWQATQSWPNVDISFGGDRESQEETQEFLGLAFGLALFSMAMLMTIQFNSLYKMLIIMSAVFLSTVGVLLGLLLTYQPFGIVMCGVGIIALAGTVVNNNIIFLDTYDEYAPTASSMVGVLKRTGAERLRPIMLTAGTGVLGLLPMVFGINIDILAWELTIDAPASQWWRQLSTTIAGGLSFATVLTLFYTPCLLVLGNRAQRWFSQRWPQWVSPPILVERLAGE
jgi:multidrug efflux pump